MTHEEQQARYEATVDSDGHSFYTDDNALVTVQRTRDRQSVVVTMTDKVGETTVVWLSRSEADTLSRFLSSAS